MYRRGGSNLHNPDPFALELLSGVLFTDSDEPRFYPSDFNEPWRGGVADDDEAGEAEAAPGADLDSDLESVSDAEAA